MRLTAKEIRDVVVYERDGIVYGWGVVPKNRVKLGIRDYINYENGKTTASKEYPKSWLPKEVVKFIDSHCWQVLDEADFDGHHFTIHIVR